MGQETDGAEQGQAHAEGAVAQTHGVSRCGGVGATLTGWKREGVLPQWFESSAGVLSGRDRHGPWDDPDRRKEWRCFG